MRRIIRLLHIHINSSPCFACVNFPFTRKLHVNVNVNTFSDFTCKSRTLRLAVTMVEHVTEILKDDRIKKVSMIDVAVANAKSTRLPIAADRFAAPCG